jgi:hypothetical protein
MHDFVARSGVTISDWWTGVAHRWPNGKKAHSVQLDNFRVAGQYRSNPNLTVVHNVDSSVDLNVGDIPVSFRKSPFSCGYC